MKGLRPLHASQIFNNRFVDHLNRSFTHRRKDLFFIFPFYIASAITRATEASEAAARRTLRRRLRR